MYKRQVRLHIDQITGTKDQYALDQNLLKLIPNPSSDYFQIENQGFEFDHLSNIDLRIYSIDGKLITARKWGNNQNQSELINIESLAAGVYQVVVGDQQSNYFSKSLIVE